MKGYERKSDSTRPEISGCRIQKRTARSQSGDEMVDNTVTLADTQGGTPYLGIEDKGTVNGLYPQAAARPCAPSDS